MTKRKQKRLKYANIPKKVLSIIIGECYGLGDYNLESELNKYGQDIIKAQWNIKNDKIEWFRAWTKDYSMILIDSIFDDKVILGLERNPPNE